jgi:hypothetical protein
VKSGRRRPTARMLRAVGELIAETLIIEGVRRGLRAREQAGDRPDVSGRVQAEVSR